MAVTTAHHAGRIKQEDLRNNRDMHHDLDGGLGSSYEENSNSSPFDLPSEIMSKQFQKLVPAPQPLNYNSY